MAKSLQEQLLGAGLVDEKKVKQANKAKRKKAKQAHKSKTVEVDETKQQIQQKLSEKADKDRQLNRQQYEASQEKAVLAQIKQLVEMNRQNKSGGDIAYNFVHDKKVKKIYVTEDLQLQLSKGRLAIVFQDDKYELVPTPVAEKIMARHADCVIQISDKPQETDEDDPYADYKIPDDLMW